jgi:hypothetical protein
MQSGLGKDIMRQTRVVTAGAFAAYVAGDTGVQRTTGVVLLNSLPARANSVSFDIPVDISIPAGQSVSYTGFVERSADGVTWVEVEGLQRSVGSWSNPAGAAGPLVVSDAIRVGADLLQDGCDRVRARVTATFPSTAIPTVRGLSVLLGGLDVRAAIPRAQRSVV